MGTLSLSAYLDKRCEEILKQLRWSEARFEPVERGIVAGDRIGFRATGAVVEDGEERIRRNINLSNYGVGLDAPLIPGFDEYLIGVKAGVELHFELPGEVPIWHVSIETVEAVVLPDVDDAFAVRHGARDVADLRRRLREKAHAQADRPELVRRLTSITRELAVPLERLPRLSALGVPR